MPKVILWILTILTGSDYGATVFHALRMITMRYVKGRKTEQSRGLKCEDYSHVQSYLPEHNN